MAAPATSCICVYVSVHGPPHGLQQLTTCEAWQRALSSLSSLPPAAFSVTSIGPSGYDCTVQQQLSVSVGILGSVGDTSIGVPLTRWSGCNATVGSHALTFVVEEVRTVHMGPLPASLTLSAARDAFVQSSGVQLLLCSRREEDSDDAASYWLLEATVRGTDVSVLESWSGSLEEPWPAASKVSVRPAKFKAASPSS